MHKRRKQERYLPVYYKCDEAHYVYHIMKQVASASLRLDSTHMISSLLYQLVQFLPSLTSPAIRKDISNSYMLFISHFGFTQRPTRREIIALSRSISNGNGIDIIYLFKQPPRFSFLALRKEADRNVIFEFLLCVNRTKFFPKEIALCIVDAYVLHILDKEPLNLICYKTPFLKLIKSYIKSSTDVGWSWKTQLRAYKILEW